MGKKPAIGKIKVCTTRRRRVVEECEWKALPEAVQMLASGKAKAKAAPSPNSKEWQATSLHFLNP